MLLLSLLLLFVGVMEVSVVVMVMVAVGMVIGSLRKPQRHAAARGTSLNKTGFNKQNNSCGRPL